MSNLCQALPCFCHPQFSLQAKQTLAGLPKQAQKESCQSCQHWLDPDFSWHCEVLNTSTLNPCGGLLGASQGLAGLCTPSHAGTEQVLKGGRWSPGEAADPAGAEPAPWSRGFEPEACSSARCPQASPRIIQSQAGRDLKAIKSSFLTEASMDHCWVCGCCDACTPAEMRFPVPQGSPSCLGAAMTVRKLLLRLSRNLPPSDIFLLVLTACLQNRPSSNGRRWLRQLL